jgi:hypothetical protein
MRIGGFLLGALLGVVLSFGIGGPFWLFGPWWFVLPVASGVVVGVVLRRVPGGRAISIAGGATTIVVVFVAAAAVCWWIVNLLIQRHGWF